MNHTLSYFLCLASLVQYNNLQSSMWLDTPVCSFCFSLGSLLYNSTTICLSLHLLLTFRLFLIDSIMNKNTVKHSHCFSGWMFLFLLGKYLWMELLNIGQLPVYLCKKQLLKVVVYFIFLPARSAFQLLISSPVPGIVPVFTFCHSGECSFY